MQVINRQISLIRHAPVTPSSRLFGQTDADIIPLEDNDINRLSLALEHCDAVFASPAKRCVKTCEAIFPNQPAPQLIDAFWEQNFGAWEDKAYTDIPDIGNLQGDALVTFRPPHGESFADVCARAIPALINIIETTNHKHMAIFAHAGVIRAFISYALDSRSAALKCEVDTLSLTRLRILPDGQATLINSNITS